MRWLAAAVVALAPSAPAAGEIGFKSAEQILGELFGNGSPAGAAVAAPVDSVPLSSLVVPFALGSSDLTADGRRQLRELAGAILAAPATARFEIAGHTDASGNAEANQRLSEARATAVVEHLVVVHGIAPDRLVHRGYGETMLRNPRAPEASENRRVEVRLIIG